MSKPKPNPFTTSQNIISKIKSQVLSKPYQVVPIVQQSMRSSNSYQQPIHSLLPQIKQPQQLSEDDFSIINEYYDPLKDPQQLFSPLQPQMVPQRDSQNSLAYNVRLNPGEFIDVNTIDQHINKVLQNESNLQEILSLLRTYELNRSEKREPNLDEQEQESRQYDEGDNLDMGEGEEDVRSESLEKEERQLQNQLFHSLHDKQEEPQQEQKQEQPKEESPVRLHSNNSEERLFTLTKEAPSSEDPPSLMSLRIDRAMTFNSKSQWKKIMNTEEEIRVVRYYLQE